MSIRFLPGGQPSWIHPEWRLGRKSVSAYLLCGWVGLMLAIGGTTALVLRMGLSPLVMAGISIVAVLTFFWVALAAKVICGKELLIYYHHQIAVLFTTGLFITVLDQPLWAYLDVTLLGVGTFLVCGRLGCLTVGCCHGRPWRWGVSYGRAHVRRGFTSYYMNIPLFPIQAVEMLWVAGVVTLGAWMVLAGHPPGSALSWYVIAYGLGRFSFEFLRGDPGRPYYLGFSEAQWISVGLMAVVAALELAGILPLAVWHLSATALMVLILCGLFIWRRWEGTNYYRLLNPPHIHQIVRVLENSNLNAKPIDQRAPMIPNQVLVGCTNQGLQISVELFKNDSASGYMVTLSLKNGRLTERVVRKLSGVIAQLEHRPQPEQILQSHPGVFHLMFKQ